MRGATSTVRDADIVCVNEVCVNEKDVAIGRDAFASLVDIRGATTRISA